MRPIVLVRAEDPIAPPGTWEEFTEPLGICYLASVLKANGYPVLLIDGAIFGLNAEQVIMEVVRNEPTLIGITVPAQELLLHNISIAQRIKQLLPNTPVILGGYSPTFMPDFILQHYLSVDGVVIGEGENIICQLAEYASCPTEWYRIPGVVCRRNGSVYHSGPSPAPTNLDDVPFPCRWLLEALIEKGCRVASIVSSRGCPWRCSFCSIARFARLERKPPWRARSPANVISEMDLLIRRYGIKHFVFQDANFMGGGEVGRRRAIQFADEIITRGWRVTFDIACRADNVDMDVFRRLRNAGLQGVFIGVESGSQNTLDELVKDIRVEENERAIRTLLKLGIKPSIGIIMFTPLAKLADIQATVELLQMFESYDLRVEGLFSSVYGYVGTDIAKGFDAELLLRDQNLPISDPTVRRLRQLLTDTIAPQYEAILYHLFRIHNITDALPHKQRNFVRTQVFAAEREARRIALDSFQYAIKAIVCPENSLEIVKAHLHEKFVVALERIKFTLVAMQQALEQVISAGPGTTIRR